MADFNMMYTKFSDFLWIRTSTNEQKFEPHDPHSIGYYTVHIATDVHTNMCWMDYEWPND